MYVKSEIWENYGSMNYNLENKWIFSNIHVYFTHQVNKTKGRFICSRKAQISISSICGKMHETKNIIITMWAYIYEVLDLRHVHKSVPQLHSRVCPSFLNG